MQFLSGHGFDFNKLFYEGIYYLSHADIKYIEANKNITSLKTKLRDLNQIISPEMIAFADIYMKKVIIYIILSYHYIINIRFMNSKKIQINNS